MTTYAFCSGCLIHEPIDAHWRALWVDSDGDLISTRPENACDLDFERPGTAFACGQTAALVIYERYLHTGDVLAGRAGENFHEHAASVPRP